MLFMADMVGATGPGSAPGDPQASRGRPPGRARSRTMPLARALTRCGNASPGRRRDAFVGAGTPVTWRKRQAACWTVSREMEMPVASHVIRPSKGAAVRRVRHVCRLAFERYRRGRGTLGPPGSGGWTGRRWPTPSRARYQPQLETVRNGARPWTKLDVLHREALDQVLADFTLDAVPEADRADFNLVWHPRLAPWPDTVVGLRLLKASSFIIALNPWAHRAGAEPVQARWVAGTRSSGPRSRAPISAKPPEAYLGNVEAVGLLPAGGHDGRGLYWRSGRRRRV